MSIITPQSAGYGADSLQMRQAVQKNASQATGNTQNTTMGTTVGNAEQYLNAQRNAGQKSSAQGTSFASAMAHAKQPSAQIQGQIQAQVQVQAQGQTLGQTLGQSTLGHTALGTAGHAKDQRMQQANLDKHHMQTLEQLSQNMGKSNNLLDVARNDVTMRNLRTVMGGFNLRAPVTPMADSIKASALAMQHNRGSIGMAGVENKKQSLRFEQEKPTLKKDKELSLDTSSLNTSSHNLGKAEIGKLSQQFESGSQGISAIGYDRVGGTSYGKYQIASRVGSMDNFLNFLDKNAPDMAETLRAAGPSNTGSKQGAMPDAWRQLAADQPERFEALQEKFIYDSHYKPAIAALRERSSLDGDSFSPAMQEVLFSTAVQHGPTGAARIFSNAAAQSGSMEDAQFDERLINNIYDIRSGQFGASTSAVQASARNRMQQEKSLALNMLQGESKIQQA